MPSNVKNPAQRLRDILDNIVAIEQFTTDLSLEEFRKDQKTIYAVTRALEIISEASRRLPDELKCRYPEIDWSGVAAAGNIYRHEYEAVDDTLIWHTVRHDLGPLRKVVQAELQRIRTSEA